MQIKTKYDLEDFLKNRSKSRNEENEPTRRPSGFMKRRAEQRRTGKKEDKTPAVTNP